MAKTFTAVLVLLIAVAIGLALGIRPPDKSASSQPPDSGLPAADDIPAPSPAAGQSSPAPTAASALPSAGGEEAGSAAPHYVVGLVGFDEKSYEVLSKRFESLVSDYTQDQVTEVFQESASVSPETAFERWFVLSWCEDAPETEKEKDVVTAAWIEQAAAQKEANYISDMLANYANKFDLCYNLPSGSAAREERFHWLTAAADGGHMLAQLLYYQYGMEYELFLRQPSLIEIYRNRTLTYLSALVRAGQPEGFYRMGRVYFDGRLLPQNEVDAVAYYLVAEKQGYDEGKFRPYSFSIRAEARLTPEESREAKSRARDLCDRYCVESAWD